VHFVGPSIWAWRYERIHFIKQAVSHMLVLFPFEEAIYRKENIPVTYVGHPLADAISIASDPCAARKRLGIEMDRRVLAILPGSRSSEIKLMAPRFLQAAQKLVRRDPKLLCIVPMVNAQREAEFNQFLTLYPVPHLRCVTASADQAAGRPIAWDILRRVMSVLLPVGPQRLKRPYLNVQW
jgi:lipid-A-disaccharide synthase